MEEGGNLILCTASSGDQPSYESDDLKHGIFTAAWLESLRGDAPAAAYEETARGQVLSLGSLVWAVGQRVAHHARQEGVLRQEVSFPQGLSGAFSPQEPVFAAVK